MLDAIILDIDGTLVDTNEAHVAAWVEAFAGFGYRVAPDRVRVEIGKGGDRLVPSVLGAEAAERDGAGLRELQTERFLARTRTTHFRPFPGVRELFAALSNRGLRTALATSSTRRQLDGVLASAGLDLIALADALVTKDDASSSKPAPDVVTAAVTKLGLSPAQCAMVGDTVYDAQACVAAGVVCLGVTTGAASSTELRAAGARATWRDVADLLAHLDEALALASPGSARLTRAALERLMREALGAAADGLAAGEAPIGAVLALGDGTILSRAYNERCRSGDLTAHAEMVAFRRAASRIPGGARDLVLVTTLEPCVMCTGAAMETGVDTVAFGLRAPADSGTGRVRPPESPDTGMPRLVGEILAAESRSLFETWLRERPNPEQRPYVEQLLALT
jgi:phosphoglycolate phosphatase-like HAD superfamily hydrolase/tRNA(Arg) A34 adenosine deaminase TadA